MKIVLFVLLLMNFWFMSFPLYEPTFLKLARKVHLCNFGRQHNQIEDKLVAAEVLTANKLITSITKRMREGCLRGGEEKKRKRTLTEAHLDDPGKGGAENIDTEDSKHSEASDPGAGPSRPAGEVNTALLQEDEERRQFEIESAFSELPTGYDDEDERTLERDFGDTLTDDELTDSKFSDFLPNDGQASRGGFEAGPASVSPAQGNIGASLSSVSGSVGSSNRTLSTSHYNDSTGVRPSIGAGVGSGAETRNNEPPEELIPGPRSSIAAFIHAYTMIWVVQ